MTTLFTKEDAEKIYHVKKWGNGYFTINDKGELTATPDSKSPPIVINEVIKEMKAQNITLPAVIRFHDILRERVKILNKKFRDIIEEANYEGRYMGVYPIKVNQMREVVEEIIEAGSKFDFGIEAGSKAELLTALAFNDNTNSLTILNGYKDEDYLRLGLMGTKLGKKIVIVIEKFSELPKLLKLSKEMGVTPLIGIRAKLSIQSQGRWAKSCGDKAKFGLTIAEILNAVQLLEDSHLKESIKLFHFHIGSQISDIRTFKDALNEGGRIYAKLIKMGVNLQYFDVGGGLGVDYDGSRSTNDSSTNYSISEYAADIVYGLKQICDLEGVPHPSIVTESGRAITAHHSCVITNIIDKISADQMVYETKKMAGEHILVDNMRDLINLLTSENYQEIYNDALQYREESLQAFKLGILSLVERAKIDTLFNQIMNSIVPIIANNDFIPEGLQSLKEKLSPQYLCNFSVFQSAADTWAIQQLLPIMPITRLNEKPTQNCSIADITCDSDGKIDRFISLDGIANTVPLHELKHDEEYLIGLFLTGAYQDVMGDMHNLFGRLNEVHIYSDAADPQGFYIEEFIQGNSASNVLATMQYNPEYMAQKMKKMVNKEISRGRILPREGVKLVNFYEECLKSYTYLKH